MPRTTDEMHQQWIERFDKRRTPDEWADFCAGMSIDGLRRAFAKQAQHIQQQREESS